MSILQDVALLNAAIDALPDEAKILIRAPRRWSEKHPTIYAFLLIAFGVVVGTIACANVMAGRF